MWGEGGMCCWLWSSGTGHRGLLCLRCQLLGTWRLDSMVMMVAGSAGSWFVEVHLGGTCPVARSCAAHGCALSTHSHVCTHVLMQTEVFGVLAMKSWRVATML